MEEAIRNFARQFGWKPEIANSGALKPHEKFVVGGMGGSHLAADILKEESPFADITVWSDYGLPPIPKERLGAYLFVASSYSGNTEEMLDFARVAFNNGLPLVCIAVGGKLIAFAKENSIPFIQMPDTGIQPRSALGFSTRAMARALGLADVEEELAALASRLAPESLRGEGKALAESLRGKVPVIYAAATRRAVAYNWKIKFNETGKIPAFMNVFPELNHNEMAGFSAEGGPASGGSVSPKDLAALFHFIFIASPADHPQVRKRMEVTEKLYQGRGFPVTKLWLDGDTRYEKIFRSLLVADWTALYTARHYGSEPNEVPMVEEFKKLIAK